MRDHAWNRLTLLNRSTLRLCNWRAYWGWSTNRSGVTYWCRHWDRFRVRNRAWNRDAYWIWNTSWFWVRNRFRRWQWCWGRTWNRLGGTYWVICTCRFRQGFRHWDRFRMQDRDWNRFAYWIWNTDWSRKRNRCRRWKWHRTWNGFRIWNRLWGTY